MSAVTKILKRAREKVADGWIQHRGVSDDGRRVCAVMAINQAFCELANYGEIDATGPDGVRVPDLANDAGGQLMVAIIEQFPTHDSSFQWPGIPLWNDFPGRTQNEVLDAFDHAIKTAEAEEK